MAGQTSHAAQSGSGLGSELLFDPALLIPSTAAIATGSTSAATPAPARADTPFPEGFTVRPLARDDYERGFLDVLRVLTHTGDVSREAFEGRFDEMKGINAVRGVHFYLVVEFQGKIVGTGTVVIERKFIHDLGLIGHIEEISIAREHQKKHLGLALLDALNVVARNVGCYKTTLGCGERTEGFYVKCGYEKRATVMSRYFEGPRGDYERG